MNLIYYFEVDAKIKLKFTMVILASALLYYHQNSKVLDPIVCS
jgi:hypothetical protein